MYEHKIYKNRDRAGPIINATEKGKINKNWLKNVPTHRNLLKIKIIYTLYCISIKKERFSFGISSEFIRHLNWWKPALNEQNANKTHEWMFILKEKLNKWTEKKRFFFVEDRTTVRKKSLSRQDCFHRPFELILCYRALFSLSLSRLL